MHSSFLNGSNGLLWSYQIRMCNGVGERRLLMSMYTTTSRKRILPILCVIQLTMKRAAKDLWYGHFGLLSFPNLEYGFSVCACVKSGNSSRRICLDQRRCNVPGRCLNSNVSAIILIETLIGVEYTTLQSVMDV